MIIHNKQKERSNLRTNTAKATADWGSAGQAAVQKASVPAPGGSGTTQDCSAACPEPSAPPGAWQGVVCAQELVQMYWTYFTKSNQEWEALGKA